MASVHADAAKVLAIVVLPPEPDDSDTVEDDEQELQQPQKEGWSYMQLRLVRSSIDRVHFEAS